MLAGMILISAAVGLLAVAATAALSFPAWVVLLSYPAICSLTLVAIAALASMRSAEPARSEQFLHTQA
jgi:hypothetical protein